MPRNSVLIREVSFGDREHHMHSQYLLPRICVLYRGHKRVSFKRGTTVFQDVTTAVTYSLSCLKLLVLELQLLLFLASPNCTPKLVQN